MDLEKAFAPLFEWPIHRLLVFHTALIKWDVKTCPWCRREFVPRSHAADYCQSHCMARAASKRQRDKLNDPVYQAEIKRQAEEKIRRDEDWRRGIREAEEQQAQRKAEQLAKRRAGWPEEFPLGSVVWIPRWRVYGEVVLHEFKESPHLNGDCAGIWFSQERRGQAVPFEELEFAYMPEPEERSG